MGGHVVTPEATFAADIGVRDGKIAAIGTLPRESAGQVMDATGLHVLPGVIDSQVHFREPGATYKEDLASGSAAAILGGVTSFFEMPNTMPPTVSAGALEEKLSLAAGRCHADYAFYVGATAENAEDLGALESLPGCAGVKLFMGSSTGTLLVDDEVSLHRIFASGRRRIAIHAEDEHRLRERKPLALAEKVETHPEWRDEETAIRATRRALRLATEHGRPVHILHVTTGQEMALLASHNRDIASVEVTPQHLTLAAPECYRRLGTLAQMNPPLRDLSHQVAFWQAVRDGIVDVIGSDHAPHTIEEKSRPYPASPSGMPGVQTLLPLLLTHYAAGRLSLSRVVTLTASRPAHLFGLRGKGEIAVGYDADLVLVDLDRAWTIEKDWLRSKCGWSPFEGWEAIGKPIATLLRGRVVARDGELVGLAEGKMLEFIVP
jgi:dihydroorotase